MANEDVEPSAPADRSRRIRELLTYRGIGWPATLESARFCHVATVLLVALTVWGYVDVSRRGRIEGDRPEVHRSDFTVYVEAGAAFFGDRDPYKVSNARGWTYLYPPIFALMVAPLAYLDTRSQVTVWYAISAVCGFGCYFEARRIWKLVGASSRGLRERPFPIRKFAAGAALAVWVPALDCLQRGQLGVALIYSLLLGYRLVLSGKSWLGGLVLSWAAVVKLIPSMPVAFLLAQEWLARKPPGSSRRAATVSAGVLLGVLLFGLAVPTALVGWRRNLQSLATWAAKVAFNGDPGQASGSHVDSYTNQSLTNAAHLLVATFRGPVPEASMNVHWLVVDTAIARRRRADWGTRWVVHGVQAIALLLLAAAGYKTARRGTALGRAVAYGLACMSIPLISPVGWGHYYVFLFPAALFAPRWLWRQGRPRAAAGLAAVSALLPTVHYVAMRYVGDYGLLGLGTTAWFLAVCVVVIRTDEEAEGAPMQPSTAHRLRYRRAQTGLLGLGKR